MAGCIISAVGSLAHAKLRLAGSTEFFEVSGKFEIVSATGTLSRNGSHIHIAIADNRGQVTGGHLVEGNLIFTTCEIVILKLAEYSFERAPDPQTGYGELLIKKIT